VAGFPGQQLPVLGARISDDFNFLMRVIMKLNNQYAWIFLLTFVLGCSKNGITPPPTNPDTNLIGTTPLTDTIMRNMEGIYTLTSGSDGLGSQFVCRVSKFKVSFFGNKDGIFFILKYGFNPTDSSIQFSGFWRYSENTTQGLINFSIPKGSGALEFLQNGIAANLVLSGAFGDGSGTGNALTLKYSRPFSAYAKAHPYQIYAHHGVQTTANPPYAQNSLNGILHDEDYGVTGMEVDVHLTKDGVPIHMHDGEIDIRLTKKSALTGDYIQYSFAFLENYIELVDGQKIPSVEQGLNAFIDSTNMKYYWMDVKGDPDIFKYLSTVVRNAYARAAAKHRDVVIYADLPSTTVIEEYQSDTSVYTGLPKMCELTTQDVIDNHCQFWGPRYSRGLLLDEVQQMHSLGIQCISWTVNEKNLIQYYLQNGQFDGMISDYPAYVNYYFYTLF
jgi:glycerophosphoryl diester phosphodiesterase